MTVRELIQALGECNPDENVYIWGGNWPSTHYTTHINVDRPFGSVCDDYGNAIENPLMLY